MALAYGSVSLWTDRCLPVIHVHVEEMDRVQLRVHEYPKLSAAFAMSFLTPALIPILKLSEVVFDHPFVCEHPPFCPHIMVFEETSQASCHSPIASMT